MKKVSAIALASAVAGALSLAAAGSASAEPYSGPLKGKCYGVSKAGQNDCANAAKTHDCAGMSKVDYDFADWKAVADKAACDKLGGAYNQPGKGKNPNAKM
jgi:uncharacterized membrane protein